MDIDQKVQAEIKRKQEEEERYRSLFSSKWVENAFVWGIYIFFGAVVTLAASTVADIVKTAFSSSV